MYEISIEVWMAKYGIACNWYLFHWSIFLEVYLFRIGGIANFFVCSEFPWYCIVFWISNEMKNENSWNNHFPNNFVHLYVNYNAKCYMNVVFLKLLKSFLSTTENILKLIGFRETSKIKLKATQVPECEWSHINE